LFFLLVSFLIWGSLSVVYGAATGYEIPAGDTQYTNSGAVSAGETVGDDLPVANERGVHSDHALDLFENTGMGSIEAWGQAGNATGDSSYVYAYYVYGVLPELPAQRTFTNSGTIRPRLRRAMPREIFHTYLPAMFTAFSCIPAQIPSAMTARFRPRPRRAMPREILQAFMSAVFTAFTLARMSAVSPTAARFQPLFRWGT